MLLEEAPRKSARSATLLASRWAKSKAEEEGDVLKASHVLYTGGGCDDPTKVESMTVGGEYKEGWTLPWSSECRGGIHQ